MARKSIFDQAAEKRRQEQESLMQTTKKKQETVEEITAVKRTTMSLSLTEDDKVFLKQYAAYKGKTVAGVIKDWIDEAREEFEK